MKKSILMLTAAALVVSCAKTDMIDSPANTDGVLIQVKSAHENVKGEVTRAPFFGSISADNHLEAKVITYKPTTNAMHADGTMIFKATSSATIYELPMTSGSHKFPTLTDSDNYTLVGLYPATGWKDASVADLVGDDFTTDVASFTFNGTQDIMVAGAKTTTEVEHAAGTYPTLTFKHQLTKLEIKVKAKDADAAAIWTELKSVKLKGTFNNVFEYTLDGGATAFDGSKADFPFYVIDNSGTIALDPLYTSDAFTTSSPIIEIVEDDGTNIVPVLYTMIAPFVSTGKEDLTLEVEANSEPAKTVKVSIPAVPPVPAAPAVPTLYNTGYAYRITLTFAETGMITAEAEVIDWIDGGEVEEIIM